MEQKHWRVAKSRSHEPGALSDRSFARSYWMEGADGKRQTTIEFVDDGSPNRALQVLRPYLRREEPPPRRLLVLRDGTVSVLVDAEPD